LQLSIIFQTGFLVMSAWLLLFGKLCLRPSIGHGMHNTMCRLTIGACLIFGRTHHTNVVPTATGVLDTVWNTWSIG
jgi:hypothetical protein